MFVKRNRKRSAHRRPGSSLAIVHEKRTRHRRRRRVMSVGGGGGRARGGVLPLDGFDVNIQPAADWLAQSS